MRLYKFNFKSYFITIYSVVFIFSVVLVSNVFAQGDLKDNDITNAIESEFLVDEVIDANTLNVTTANGIVTLSGTTHNILTKDRALEIASTIKGVRSIINRIDVQSSLLLSDDDIQKSVKKALLLDAATEAFEVQVQVADGIVTLDGSVQSWAEKKLCTSVAKGVKGVRKVKNDITIDYAITRPDIELKAEIEGILVNDVQVDDYLIDVAVNDGAVTLSGIVGSLREKIRAKGDAWVVGVTSVDAEDLKIEWWVRDRLRREKDVVSRNDEEIKKAVKAALLYDPRVFSFNPNVEVSDGTVTLTGIVDNIEAKKTAEQDARNTTGTWRVKNHIKVRPEIIPSNQELENRVLNAFVDDPYIERFEISVSASIGWIFLSGDVHTSFEKHHAQTVAEGVQGVTNVINNIRYEYQWTWKPDWVIEDDVNDQLTWSVYVNEDDIEVSVNDGIVKLNGEVDNFGEYNSAEKNAYEGGAKDVVNNLTVDLFNNGPFYPYDSWYYPYYPYN
jgi:osmotically-inducible protein OsmY